MIDLLQIRHRKTNHVRTETVTFILSKDIQIGFTRLWNNEYETYAHILHRVTAKIQSSDIHLPWLWNYVSHHNFAHIVLQYIFHISYWTYSIYDFTISGILFSDYYIKNSVTIINLPRFITFCSASVYIIISSSK